MRRIEILNKDYQHFGLNVPIPELNNKTLKEVFENGNKNTFSFADWLNNSTGDGTTSVTNGILRLQDTTGQAARYKPSIMTVGKWYIVIVELNVVSGSWQLDGLFTGNQTVNNYILKAEATLTLLQVKSFTSSNPTDIYVKKILLYDLLELGISTISTTRMNYWYDVFKYYKYNEIKPNFQYPFTVIPTDPTGLGNKYSLQELNKVVYGHELDFDNIQLNLIFGIYKNSYQSFNLLMNFLIDNECILEYDYGTGIRYVNARIINAPKTEMEPGRIIRSKFDFKRLTPFYTLLQGSYIEVVNTHDWKIKPIVEGTVNTNTVYIDAEDLETIETLSVKFDFTSVSKPFNFYYNAETKQILINGVNIGYKYIDIAYGKTFIEIPKGNMYSITSVGITNPVVKIKKWVID